MGTEDTDEITIQIWEERDKDDLYPIAQIPADSPLPKVGEKLTVREKDYLVIDIRPLGVVEKCYVVTVKSWSQQK